MRGPKTAVIGAGSYIFGKKILVDVARSDVLGNGELALVDTDPVKLETMLHLAERVVEATGSRLKVIGSVDRREVLAGSDCVVFSFARRNAHYRGLDTRIAAKHGIHMCSSDTIGPGGIFRALREVPQAIAIAQDVRELAPQAWILNYVNPSTVIGMALRRYVPQARSMAICDGLHEPYVTLELCRRAGILAGDATQIPPDVASKLDLAIAGVNHCTWLLRMRYDGVDMLPKLRQQWAAHAQREREHATGGSKARYNYAYAIKLLDLYGAWPALVGHTKEYVPFFQGYGVAQVDPEPITLFDADTRAAQMAAAWEETKAYSSGSKDIADLLQPRRSDMAADMIESMWASLGKSFYINTANRGAVTNLPDDAFIELRCDLDMHGPRPQPVGEFPRGLLALQYQVLDTHELTAEAAATGDRTILRRAMLTDPICNNIEDADNCIAELLEAERDALPEYWF